MADYILERSQYYNYPASRIVFEITERIEINDLTIAYDFIKKLKTYGFSFALDDFGDGYSSFAYLTKLPIDYIKIDKKITCGLLSNPVDHDIVRSILLLAKSRSIKMIAEGVESVEISNEISQYSIDYLQGYYFSLPLSFEEFMATRNITLQLSAV